MVDGMNIKGLSIPKHVCESCRIANATVRQGKKIVTPVDRRGQRVFVDIGGGHVDMPPGRKNGAHYWLIFVDQFDGFVTVKTMKFRSAAFRAIQLYTEESDRASFPIQIYHSDNAGEF